MGGGGVVDFQMAEIDMPKLLRLSPEMKADAIAAARYLTEEALAKCAGAGLM